MLNTDKTIRVFVSSPYTLGETGENVRAQIDAGDILMDNGFTPFLPLLCHFWGIVTPKPYADWLGWCFEWIEVCDCVFRLPGESPGAEKEVMHAVRHGKSVFTDINDLISYYKK